MKLMHSGDLEVLDESGENVNFKAPIIVEFLVERGEHGCFRVFFRGGDGASLAEGANHDQKPFARTFTHSTSESERL